MEKKHTPLPWAQSHREVTDRKYSTQVYSESGETIATIHWYPMPETPDGVIGTYREGNAALIVKAVNNHYTLTEQRDELLAALKGLISETERCDNPSSQGVCSDSEVMTIARKVVAKTEGAA